MAVLDRVTQMQQQGMQDQDISRQLQMEGINPKEINDALNQARIKNAVTNEQTYSPEQGQMQGSIMNQPQMPQGQMTQEIQEAPQQPQEQSQQPYQEYAPQQNQDYYAQQPQSYSEQGYYPPQGPSDPDLVSEIAEQVVSEKMKEMKSKVNSLNDFKTQAEDSISDLDERLKRIENSIEKLQQAIIGKIGEFGENTAMIRKDLENLHETTSKLMNPLIDNYKELQKIAKK